MNSAWVLPSILIVVFAAMVGILALRKHRRVAAVARTAEDLGLRYSEGDPLGLGRDLGADVYETVWGRFEGADVAVATAARPVPRDIDDEDTTWETRTGVSMPLNSWAPRSW